MNVSSRVPGRTRNSGWRAVDAEIASKRVRPQPGCSESGLLQEGGVNDCLHPAGKGGYNPPADGRPPCRF
jgi:hypothetical protein